MTALQPMRSASRIAHAAELFRILRKSPQNPSVLASEFLHARKSLSADDRRVISGLAFAALRHSEFIDACMRSAPSAASTAAPNARLAVLITLAVCGDLPTDLRSAFEGADLASLASVVLELPLPGADALLSAIGATGREILARADAAIDDGMPASARAAALAHAGGVPEWIIERWLGSTAHPRSGREVRALVRSLTQPAPVVLRVNLARTSRTTVLAVLADAGIDARVSEVSPAGIVLAERDRITDLPLYTNGDIEVQDEASQLAALALAPDPGWSVLDACAGAGGKTLHVADLQADQGTILAADIESVRLRSLSARALRAGVRSVRTTVIRGDRLPGDAGETFDAVLVDAPCSAIGTARRTPTVLHRLTPRTLERTAARQRAMLALYAACVHRGGTLVYSTCSLMPEENEEVVRDFLATDARFQPDPLLPAFRRSGAEIPDLSADAWHITLDPAAYGTDGFFIARMRRIDW